MPSSPDSSDSAVSRARDFAVAAHGFQRYGSRPYVFHLDQVARQVREWGPLFERVAFLHDVLEDTRVTEGRLEETFGRRVARCVALVSDPENRTREERKATINRRLSSVERDSITWPGLVVKIADRLCNVRMCVEDQNEEQLARYANEHRDFRAAAWRPEFEATFEELERLLDVRPRAGSASRAEVDPAKLDAMVAEYAKRWSEYQAIGAQVADEIEGLLVANGIHAMVSFRAKAPERLRGKVLDRNWGGAPTIASLDDLVARLADVVGVRVALYYPDDQELVGMLLNRNFEVTSVRTHSGSQSLPASQSPRFSGYWAQHYRMHRPGPGGSVPVEIQSASVLMYAWAHVNHDLAYKPLSGELSESEAALIDQLNGLVLASETAVRQLRKATRARLAREDGEMHNHFELGSWLVRWARSQGRPTRALGRVDRLYELLRELDRLRPSQLETLVRQSVATRPLADQVIERLLIEEPGRVTMLPALNESTGRLNPQGAVRELPTELLESSRAFSELWSSFERTAALALTGSPKETFPVGKKRLAALPIDEEQREKVRRARAVMADLARRGDRVTAARLEGAYAQLETIIEALSRCTKLRS